MAAESPIALIYGSDGATYIETSIRAGIAVPSGQPGFMALGSDGTNTRYLKVSNTGVLIVDGSAVTQPVSGTFWQATQPVSAASLPLPSGAATEATLATLLTLAGFQARIPVNGQAVMAASIPVAIASNQSVLPINDNAGSLTVDSPQLPAALVGSRLDTNVGAWLGSTAPTVGQKTMANSVPVALASDQAAIPVSQSGTWTVQPGNTANTTAWRVEGQKTHNNAAPNGNNIGVLPAVANSSAPTVTDGNQVALSTDLNGQLRVTASTTGSEEASYTVIGQAVQPGNNKSMISIYNPVGSGYVLKLREFYLRNAATSAVTGVAGAFQLHRFADSSAPTGGTTLTVVAHDSADALPSGMDARTGGTVTGEIATPLDILRMSTDEWGPGTADVESGQQAIANYLPARAKRDSLLKPMFARPGEGLHIKFATNSTAGLIDLVLVFTKV